MQKPQDNLDLFNLDKIIFEKINRINELTEEITKRDSELEILDEDIQKFHQKIKRKNKEITSLDQLVRQKEDEITSLDQLVRQKEDEITSLDQLVRQKDKDLNSKNCELIEIREELAQIHNSIIFKFSKSISKIIDSIFPNNSKRGEFKKIVIASIILIRQEGLRKYILTVKTKIVKKEFKINTFYSSNSNLSISEKDKIELIKKVQDNHKNRLKIRPSTKAELQNDGFIIIDDKELI
ncbi:MAG: hypothetical protein OEQ94_01375 [Nitrosopumilus sp.]|nr:hypothetical protein [Nitrosopumilus sp.]